MNKYYFQQQSDRIVHLKGTPREMGLVNGHRMGKRLSENIEFYIKNRPQIWETLDYRRLQKEALSIFYRLPERVQLELEGMAEGAGVPLQLIAEWVAVDYCTAERCSSFVTVIDGHIWVGRNNDFLVPEVWGYVIIRDTTDRIPTITFGTEGDIFPITGLNREQLWLHSHFLPIGDKPRPDKTNLAKYCYVLEALETCSNINDIERMLKTVDRSEGMILFAVDGKNEESSIFECNCQTYVKRIPADGKMVATNHSNFTEPASITESSKIRRLRLEELVVNRPDWENMVTPDDLIQILADDRIEQRESKFTTVYSNIACPGTKTLWYTLGGYPAASNGNWTKIAWPW